MFLLPEPPMPALTAGGFFVFHYMFSDGRSDYYYFFLLIGMKHKNSDRYFKDRELISFIRPRRGK